MLCPPSKLMETYMLSECCVEPSPTVEQPLSLRQTMNGCPHLFLSSSLLFSSFLFFSLLHRHRSSIPHPSNIFHQSHSTYSFLLYSLLCFFSSSFHLLISSCFPFYRCTSPTLPLNWRDMHRVGRFRVPRPRLFSYSLFLYPFHRGLFYTFTWIASLLHPLSQYVLLHLYICATYTRV